MKTQTKLWLAVAALFLLMALAWTAMFTAASKADVQFIKVPRPSDLTVRNTNIYQSTRSIIQSDGDSGTDVRNTNIEVLLNVKSGGGS